MLAQYSNTDMANGKIRIAIQRLAADYPFHAKLLEMFDIHCDPNVRTLGVSLAADTVRLVYNPGFITRISLAELGGVLLHVLHHVLFGHVFADPNDNPDRWARIVSEELTVNEFVREPLPGRPIRLKMFPGLPPRESTDQRYRRLKRCKHRFSVSTIDGHILVDARGRANDKTFTVPDDHASWTGTNEERGLSEANLRATIQDAVAQVGVSAVPGHLHEALARMGVGSISQDGQYELQKEGRGRLDWARLLRRYVGQALIVQYDFTRPPRRFPSMVGIIPGRRRRGGRPKVMAIIDTSGSITPQLLEKIDAELARLAARYEVLVVECDAEIRRVYPYKPVRSVSGRGGTDFHPPLAARFLHRHRPDLIVYFTDGFGSAPNMPPRVPVVWCLTPGGQTPASWGRVIKMSP